MSYKDIMLLGNLLPLYLQILRSNEGLLHGNCFQLLASVQKLFQFRSLQMCLRMNYKVTNILDHLRDFVQNVHIFDVVPEVKNSVILHILQQNECELTSAQRFAFLDEARPRTVEDKLWVLSPAIYPLRHCLWVILPEFDPEER